MLRSLLLTFAVMTVAQANEMGTFPVPQVRDDVSLTQAIQSIYDVTASTQFEAMPQVQDDDSLLDAAAFRTRGLLRAMQVSEFSENMSVTESVK